MNDTNLEIKNLQDALNNQGFTQIAESISVLANDPNVNIEPLNEVEYAPYDKLYVTESVEGKTPNIDGIYEKEIFDDLKKLAEAEERVAAHKERIKAFIETNGLSSFNGSLLGFKYNSATTTTTIDTTRLKAEQPEIAAKYSKVGTRASSLSIKELN